MGRSAALLSLLLLAAAALAAASDVLVVEGEESLNKMIKENDFLVLEIYAPW